MADSSVAITAGSGTLIDTRTDPNGQHRQVVTIGDGSSGYTTTVGSDGAMRVQNQGATTASRSTAGPATELDTQIIGSNTARRGCAIFNASSEVLYLGLGSAAVNTTNNYTLQVAPFAYYEVPFGYTGVIRGVWAVLDGLAIITEVT